MMMNLFSIFDPSTSLFYSMNWLSSIYVMLFIPNIYWLIPSRWIKLLELLYKYLCNEFKVLMNSNLNKINLLIYISLFLLIMFNNFMGLFSYIFTSSSHMSMSLVYSLVLWISFMLYGWIMNTNHMFTHLVPQGTPNILMPFMVLIESISNIIRAGTLAVRLSANMIAGHLLLVLLSSSSNGDMYMYMLVILAGSILFMLEISVSIIQGYVFSVLSTLYSAESN